MLHKTIDPHMGLLHHYSASVVLVSNVLARVVMGWYRWRGHPRLEQQLGAALGDRDMASGKGEATRVTLTAWLVRFRGSRSSRGPVASG